jgi:hypothetical protein
MSDTIPSDIVSVYDNANQQWWLYYISTDQQLSVIAGPKDGQLEDAATNPPYEPKVVQVENFGVPKPKAGNSQLGVAEYLDNNGNPQVLSWICIEARRANQANRPVSTTSKTTTLSLSWAGMRLEGGSRAL